MGANPNACMHESIDRSNRGQVLQLQKLEVLSKDEMTHLTADLLENHNPDLFREFKRMVEEAVSVFGHLVFSVAVEFF